MFKLVERTCTSVVGFSNFWTESKICLIKGEMRSKISDFLQFFMNRTFSESSAIISPHLHHTLTIISKFTSASTTIFFVNVCHAMNRKFPSIFNLHHKYLSSIIKSHSVSVNCMIIILDFN